MSGLYVVYTDNGNCDIYLYDAGTGHESNLTPGTLNDQFLEDINGSNVVYTNASASSNDIFLYGISFGKTTPLTAGGNHFNRKNRSKTVATHLPPCSLSQPLFWRRFSS